MFLAAVAADTVVEIENRNIFALYIFQFQRTRRTRLDTAAAADTPLGEQYRTGSGKVAELLFEKRRQRYAPGIEHSRGIREFEGGNRWERSVIFVSKGDTPAGSLLEQHQF